MKRSVHEVSRLGALSLALAATLAGCQCSGGNGSDADSGSTGSDGDTDTDSDSDTESDSCPGEEIDVALDPALEWESIPAGMECGPGCQQLSGTDGAIAFDVWGDWVIVHEHSSQTSSYITYVDVLTENRCVIDHSYQTIDMLTYQPTVYDSTYFFLGREAPDHEYRYIWGTLAEKGHRLLEPCTGSVYELDAWAEYLAYIYRPSGDGAGTQDLYLLNRETLERRTVTTFGGVGEITLSGDWVTFTRIGGNVEIYAYNVVTEELTNISDHPSDQFNSRNDGPRVVWTDLRADPGAEYYDWSTYDAADIWFYDIETEELRQITSGDGAQIYPDINGDWIVWQDSRECANPSDVFGDCRRIWGYNLATEEERQISQIPASEARVWGDRVFFGARYEEDPPKGAVFVQDLNELSDAGPDGGE